MTRFARTLLFLSLSLVLAGCAKQVTTSSRPADADQPPRPHTPFPLPSGMTLAHTVRDGETLARIADLYYADPARARDLAKANGLADPEHLAPGSVIALSFGPQEWDDARRRATALEPYNRGVDAMEAGDFEHAEREFRISLQTAPELVDPRYNLALVLMKRGRYEEAQHILAELATQRPRDADIGFALGNGLFYQTRYDEAAAAFRRVLSFQADHLRAAFGEARSLQEAGRRDEAVAAWRRYLELDATSSWADVARRNLAELQGGGR